MDSDIIAEMRWTMADNPVTNAEYAAFVAAGGDPGWPGPCGGADSRSAVRVDYPHAVAYCEWRSGVDGAECRLPTDGEWQAWAEGLPDGDPRRVVVDDDVWEWTSSAWGGEPDTLAVRRVVRGGSWGDGCLNARAASRDRDYPGHRYSDVGFRVVRAAPVSLTSGVAGVPAADVREIAELRAERDWLAAEVDLWMDAARKSWAEVARLREAMPDAATLDNAALALSAAGMTRSPLWRDMMDSAARIRALPPATTADLAEVEGATR